MIVRRAHLVLAGAFAAVMLTLLGLFAAGVYLYAARTFDLDASAGEQVGPDAAERGLAALRSGLTLAFCLLAVLVPIASYLLAGLALAPVRAAYDREQRLSDDAAHELRTPVSVLRAVLELAIDRERPPDEYRAAIGTALEVIDGLDRLTAQLLLAARTGDRALRTSFVPVDLGTVVQDAVNRNVAEPRGTARIVLLLPATPVPVRGAADLLLAAVANLLRNALTAAGPRGQVRVRVIGSPGRVGVEVRDDGPGMTAEQLARAGERFWRADTTGSGHGIGLALVRQVADLHHGRLELRSTPGVGTVATLSLPVDAARHRRVMQRFLAWRQPRPGHPEQRSTP